MLYLPVVMVTGYRTPELDRRVNRSIDRYRRFWRAASALALSLVWVFSQHLSAVGQQDDVAILSPQPGQAVQGVAAITGSASDPNLTSYEVQFAYHRSKNATWFLIQEGQQSVSEGLLATWDGSSRESVVEQVRVRNYSTVETNTPAPTTEVTREPTATVPTTTMTPFNFTVTPLPPNPAELTGFEIAASIAQGSLAVVVLAVIIGMYFAMRRLFRR
jgi:hypothetical protein